jgi:dihydrofolate reductase
LTEATGAARTGLPDNLEFMKTIYFAAASLDGFIADKNDSLEWLFKNGPTDISFIDEFLETVGVIAMGSTTYQWLLDNTEGPWPYKAPCVVFTHRNLRVMEGADVRFARGEVPSQHEELVKLAGGKNIWLMGGGDLVGQFYDHKLVDEMHIQTVAVFLNEGKKLFSRRTNEAFKIQEIRQRGDTCVEVIYLVR